MSLSVYFLQDLKEKKLVEEKENGKDAATNGKVTASIASISLATTLLFLRNLNKKLNFYPHRFRV